MIERMEQQTNLYWNEDKEEWSFYFGNREKERKESEKENKNVWRRYQVKGKEM
jgi:cAMP phosphodiesterase